MLKLLAVAMLVLLNIYYGATGKRYFVENGYSLKMEWSIYNRFLLIAY